MTGAPLPANEAERLQAVHALCLLDTPVDPAFDLITDLAARTFGVPIALVSLIDEGRQWFKSRVGLAARETPRSQAFCAYAIHHPEPLVVLDATRDERFVANPLVIGAPHIRFYAGAPLVMDGGIALGTLCIIGDRPRDAFSDHERALLQGFAALVKRRIETLHTIGYVDPLTHLPNRERFVHDLDLWLTGAEARPVIAVALDVCGTEYHADMTNALGPGHAERYLLAAKDRLLAWLPSGATAYRIDTTCFGLIWDSGGAPPGPQLERLARSYLEPLDLHSVPHACEPSVAGVVPEAGSDATELLRALLTTTHALRREGRAWGEYDRVHDDAHCRAFGLLAALSQALSADDELSLHYQPRIDLASGQCVGVEALLRWNHLWLGPVPPSEFIPLAEKTTLIVRLTRWVLNEALRQAAAWQRDGHCFGVSINVSALDLDEPDFVEVLCRLLERHAVDPRRIELEFTESALSRNADRLEAALQRIRALGIGLAIDDFGTGYSNLNYLKRIPATVLKIDQSFVRSLADDARDRTIVPSLIRLGHDLGYRVVAEGVETSQLLELLASCGCDEGQGYAIARPMPAEQLGRWVTERARKRACEGTALAAS